MVDRDYPALAFVPADATAAITAARLDDLVRLMREGGDFLLMLDGHYMRDVDGFMKARFGASPFVADDLAAAGINIGGSAALFARGRGVTAVLPVANRGQVAEILERHIPVAGSELLRRHDLDLKIWRGEDFSVSYALSDAWLLLHAGDASGDPGWLDEVVAVRGRGLAAEPLFARAKSRAVAIGRGAARRFRWKGMIDRPDVVGVIRPAALVADFAITEPCLARAAEVSPTVLVGAEVSWDRIAGFFELELTGAASEVLASDRPAAPTTGLMDLMSSAPMAGLWTLPASVLETARQRWQCGELDDPIDPSMVRGATSGAAIGWSIDPRAPTETVGVLRVTGLDGSVLRSLLGRIPGRSFFEKKKTIAGVELTVLGGSLGIPEIGYRIRGAAETAIGSPASRVAAALSGRPADGVPLIHMRLAPAEIGNLPALAGEALATLTGDRAAGVKLGKRLSRYKWGELSVVHDGGLLRLTAAMQLAQ